LKRPKGYSEAVNQRRGYYIMAIKKGGKYLQNATQKTKDRAPERLAISAPLDTPVMLLLSDTKHDLIWKSEL
jgi:hypothetical protein